MSARITDNIHLKGHTYLISGHDGKAQRGQDIFDEKGRTGRNNEISSSLPPLSPGKPRVIQLWLQIKPANSGRKGYSGIAFFYF